MDVERLAEGLWRWTVGEAGSAYYEVPDAVVLFDPLVPAGEEEEFLAHLDRDVERLGLPVSILLTSDRFERSAPLLRERYGAGRRMPVTVEFHSVAGTLAYFIRPHNALVIATLGLWPVASWKLPVEFVLVSELAG